MMKKLLAMTLALALALTLSACGGTGDGSASQSAPGSSAPDSSAPQEPDGPQGGTSGPQGETIGQQMLAAFQAEAAANPGAGAEALAQAMVECDAVPFEGGMAMAVEEGLLNGFDNAEITGFQEGAMFSPMISVIPFLGYIFVLEDGADVDAFITTLKDNANLGWNICTCADEMVVEHEGQTVFFLMCPSAMDGEGGDGLNAE